jgi:hypothetical protein
MKTSSTVRFLIDATQTAYLWSRRNYYGDRNSAIRAFCRRQSAKKKKSMECKNAFNLGLAVVNAVENKILKLTLLRSLSERDAKRIADKISSDVQRSIPESKVEMVEYAIGILFWMPLQR